jgi:hypothetical protein
MTLRDIAGFGSEAGDGALTTRTGIGDAEARSRAALPKR